MSKSADIVRLHKNPRYSSAVIHNNIVYLAGIVGNDAKADVKEQTRQVLGKIDALLKETGTNKSRLLTAQVWLADVKDFDAFNSVWESWVDKENVPTRATGESKLPGGWKVEIILSASQSRPSKL